MYLSSKQIEVLAFLYEQRDGEINSAGFKNTFNDLPRRETKAMCDKNLISVDSVLGKGSVYRITPTGAAAYEAHLKSAENAEAEKKKNAAEIAAAETSNRLSEEANRLSRSSNRISLLAGVISFLSICISVISIILSAT